MAREGACWQSLPGIFCCWPCQVTRSHLPESCIGKGCSLFPVVSDSSWSFYHTVQYFNKIIPSSTGQKFQTMGRQEIRKCTFCHQKCLKHIRSQSRKQINVHGIPLSKSPGEGWDAGSILTNTAISTWSQTWKRQLNQEAWFFSPVENLNTVWMTRANQVKPPRIEEFKMAKVLYYLKK